MTRRPLLALLLLGVLACSEDGTGPGRTPPGDLLKGDSGALASTAIAPLAYEPRLEDYSTDHPQLAGLRLSTRVLNLVLRPEVTVGQANALLGPLGADIVGGISGTASLAGILALRLPTQTHAAMESALAALRRDARVAHAVQEQLVDPLAVPAADPTLPSWSWDLEPNGGNWGLEISRVPQLWNLNAAVRKAGATTLLTGMYDVGFAAHTDLVFLNSPAAGSTPKNTAHGTHVAGIIGALFGDTTGVDGVNPFARLVGALAVTQVWGLYALIVAHPEMKVINVSVGATWANNTDLNTNVAAQQLANEGGATLRQALALLEALRGSLPVIVAAAGNESNPIVGLQPAAYASAYNNAGLIQGAANIIVVESLDLVNGVATRLADSNIGGHVSAPGGNILSTIPGTYGFLSGTSMAAPHVAGLAGYLYALDPSLPPATLSSNPVRALILATAVATGGGAMPRMDAFAAALALDGLHGNDRVLRLLADMDDGTADGNTRSNADGSVNTTEDADGDGGQGDGVIDMSDFRRWRDAFLDLDQPSGYVLDGDPAHPKRDLNGNGRTAAEGDDEFIYPRLDLNGDGKVGLAQRAHVGGAIRAQVTDLEVLMARFDDEHYQASELNQLIRSGDAHVDASVCLARPEVLTARSWVEVTGSGVREESRSHDPAPGVHVYTLAENAAGWTLHLEGLDGSGQVEGHVEREIDVKPGSDEHWKSDCAPQHFSDFTGSAAPEWSSTNITTSPSGQRYLGDFQRENIRLSLTNLPAHEQVRVTFNFYTISDWEGSAPPSAGGQDTVSFRLDGQTLLVTSFSTKPGFPQAYPGSYPASSNPPMTGATATASLGYPGGSGHTGDATYRISFTVPHTASTLVFSVIGGVNATQLSGERWGLDNVRVIALPSSPP